MNNQLQSSSEITKEIINHIINDQVARRAIIKQSHLWFFHLYFSQYVKYPTAEFQKEMFTITEDENIKTAIIVAFRGSAKSTIMTMSYPIWAILGKLQKKCVVILSQTQQQAKTHFANIKRELEGNDLLRRDLGPFQEESEEWGSFSLVIPEFNARIVAASSEQSIRGMRYGANRPDLIICDDVEDLSSTKTREGRDKTFSWFTGEIIPCGDKNTKIIVVGNLLHEDSLLMRLRGLIDEGKINAIYKEYPLVDSNGQILWQGMFQNMEEIEEYKKTIGDEKAWQREYMLKIIADEDQVIKKEWIHYYDEIPIRDEHNEFRYNLTGVDLAISEKESADCTAMVTATVLGYSDTLKIYIHPFPINERIDFPKTIKKAKEEADKDGIKNRSTLLIEDIGYQRVMAQQLVVENFKAERVSISGMDKRSRLSLISPLIQSGKILFPRKGAEQLIEQIVYFGVEKHDDLCDALTLTIQYVLEQDRQPIQILSREVYEAFRGGSSYTPSYWNGDDTRPTHLF